jgi:iron complex outermembrane receptor protein
MKNIILLAIAIATAGAAIAQNNVNGIITNQQGEPLAGANVFVMEQNKGTVTDKEGHYFLKNLPKGKFKINYSFVGYDNRLVTVIMDDKPLEIDMVLQHEPIETESVVVVGGYNSTQHENAVKIDVIKSEAISRGGTPNFAEILTKIPGVDMISKGNGISKPVIRGLAMNDILVLNNGVRYENYQYSDHHPLGIDEFGIESVEVIKGPASLLYGSDAIGGVVDFVKEKPAPVGRIIGDYNLQLNSNSLGATTNLGVKGASQNFFWGIRGGGKTNADYNQGGGELVPNSRFNEWSVKGNGGFAGKRGTFKLFYDVNEQKIGIVEPDVIDLVTERGRKAEFWFQTFNNKLLSSQNKLYLGNYKVEINGAFQNTHLTHNDERTTPYIEMHLATLTYETKIYFPSVRNGEYIIGFQGLNQHNRNLNNRETRLLSDAGINSYSGFTLLQHTFIEKIRLQAGMRYDHRIISTDSDKAPADADFHLPLANDYNSLSGSFGATCNVSEKFLIRANLAAAFRSPNLAELTSGGLHENRYEIGNPGLKPQRAREADVSAHYHFDNLSLDLAGFYNKISDYIFITPTEELSASGFPVYRYKQSDARLFGGEAVIHIHPKPIEWLHFETTFATVTGKKDNEEFLPLVPANKLRFELRAEKEQLLFMEKAFLKINLLNAFKQINIAPEEEETAGYSLVDLGIGANLKVGNQPVVIGITANNIFDTKYIDHLSTLKEAGFFNPGRNIGFNLKIPFGSY